MFKNLVIISIDSLRADGINYSKDLIYSRNKKGIIKTPNLDRFAKSGTTFINSYSTNTYTTSSHASLFTGSFPPNHKIRAFFDFKQSMNPNLKTIAEELNSNKFQTFFYSDVQELFSIMDIWRGFKVKTYSDMNWLWNSIEELKKDRNFVFIHTFDIHEPYLFIEDKAVNKKINFDYYSAISDLRKKLGIKSKINQEKKPSDSWREIRLKTAKENLNEFEILKPYYDKGIEKYDEFRFPIVLEKLNDLGFNDKNTLFILLSDHGEGRCWFDNSNYFLHGGELTQEVIQNFNCCSIKSDKTNSLTSIVDVYSTSLSLLGVENNSKSDSINIFQKNRERLYIEQYTANKAPFMKDFNDSDKNFNIKIGEIKAFVNQRGIVENNYKTIFQGKPEFTFLDQKELHVKKFITESYRSLLKREPDEAGLKKYTLLLKQNRISRTDFYKELKKSPEFLNNGLLKTYYVKGLTDKNTDSNEIIKALSNKYVIKKSDDFVFNLFSKVDKESQEIEQLKNEINHLKGHLNMIKSSKFYKLWRIYHKYIDKLISNYK